MNKIYLKISIIILVILNSSLGCVNLPNTREKRSDQGMNMKPLVIGHRGAPGHTPEHTLHSYGMAVDMGADIFEPDLVSTKDGVLIARHENEISETTNVAEKYPSRKTTKVIDKKKVEGYFTEDFTLAEIKTLKVKERLSFRNQKENGYYPIATFEEILELREKLSKIYGQEIGIAPELKHSTYFKTINLPLEDKFIELIKKFKLDGPMAPVLVQSFEISNLKYIHEKLPHVQIVQLLDEPQEKPADQVRVTYAKMATVQGFKEMSKYANWVSPWKPYLIPFDPKTKSLLKPTKFVELAHAQGLKVVPYTFRNENQYLSKDDQGTPESEYIRFFELGVDAVFSDYPDTAVAVRNEYLKKSSKP
jgi:glycerophosphoryl diester phosphodiesterase